MPTVTTDTTDYSRNYSKNEVFLPPLVEQENEEPASSSKGRTLDQIFEKNQLIGNLPKSEQKQEKLGLFKLLGTLLNLGKKAEIAPKVQKTNSKDRTVNFTPCLDVPANLPLDLKNFKLAQLTEPTCQMSDQEIFTGLGKLSDHTMYQIMHLVMLKQNELSHEGALISMDDFEQFHKMQVYQQQAIKEIKKLLIKDEKFKNYFKTIQNIAAAVATIATIATLLSFTIPVAFIAAGVAAAVSAGGKSYFSVRSDQDTAKLIGLNHQMKVARGHMTDANERMETAVKDINNEKILGKLLRDQLELVRMILKK